MKSKLKFKRWEAHGEFSGKEKSIQDVLDSAGNILDANETGEMMGPNVFTATNGRQYKVVVEARIVPISRAEAHDILEAEGLNPNPL